MDSSTINKTILLQYINGDLSDKEKIAKVKEWVNQNNQNKEYFKSLKALYLASELDDDEISNLKKNIWERVERNTIYIEKLKNKRPINANVNWFKYVSIAASILLIISLGTIFLLVNNNKKSERYYSFRAESGSKSEVTLPDGTLVYLNSETELRLPHNFSDGNRHVTLYGEAYFKVEKTESKSLFIVNTGDIAIKVLGTEFNVKSYPDEGTIETTLEKGKVALEKQSSNGSKELLTLKPMQRAVFVKEKGNILLSEIEDEYPKTEASDGCEQNAPELRKEKILLKDRVETNVYTSWKEGKLIFKSERFDNLLIRMERWYGIDIQILNDSIKDIRFTGILKNETIEQALDALKISQPFNYMMDIEKNIVFIN